MAPKAPVAIPSISKVNKVISEDILEDFKKFKVRMSALRRDQRSKSSRPIEDSKGFVMWCIFCDDPSHKCGECGLYVDALKESINTFKEEKIRDVATDEPLKINFDRGGIKKLMEEKLGKINFAHARGANTYHIEARLSNVEAFFRCISRGYDQRS